jgi:hypothetical protein
MFRRKNNPPVPRQRPPSTLPQSQPSSAFSYHAKRSDREAGTGRQQSDGVPARQTLPAVRLKKTTLTLLLTIMLALAFYLLPVSTQVSVKVVDGSKQGLPLASNTVYAEAAENVLNQSPTNRLKIGVQTNKVSHTLLSKYPELQQASLTVPFIGRQPTLHIQAAKPAMVIIATNGEFALDSQGKVLVMTSNLSSKQSLSVPVVTDQSNLRLSLNKPALTPNNVRFIAIVLGQLKAKHINYSSLTLPPSASELDVGLANKPYAIKFNLQSDTAREQAGTFLAAQKELDRQHITPIHYIDVRVEGRAYYQ